MFQMPSEKKQQYCLITLPTPRNCTNTRSKFL